MVRTEDLTLEIALRTWAEADLAYEEALVAGRTQEDLVLEDRLHQALEDLRRLARSHFWPDRARPVGLHPAAYDPARNLATKAVKACQRASSHTDPTPTTPAEERPDTNEPSRAITLKGSC